jgi:CubicO group peptidase (beta-lactamase class C family)
MGFYFDQNIPNDAHTYIGDFTSGPGVEVVAFTPSGGWVVVAANGAYHAEGIPHDCFTTLSNLIQNGWTVRSIAFPPAGGDSWVIVADQGYYARNIPNDCFTAIGNFFDSGIKITCVAFPPSGGDAWVIIANDALLARNIDDECFQTLCNYTQGIRRATQVSFAPNGGWVIYGDYAYFARNIDPGCYSEIQSVENAGWLVAHVAFTASGGWSVIANNPLPATQDPLRIFENTFFEDSNGQWHSIYDRMTYHGVPGASVAFVQKNAVAWRTSYGLLEAGGTQRVYTNTPFQAGSLSKPHTSIATQVFARLLSIPLIDPVAKHTSWSIPTRSCASNGWAGQTTIQQTLQHRGGFIGNGNTFPLNVCTNFTPGQGGGFGGYGPGLAIPTLDEILTGTAPANSPEIEITTPPGNYYYSGMGYVAIMRMLEDMTGADFQTCMQQAVLTPLGMSGSTFSTTLPAGLSRAAAGHDTNGNPIPGLRNTYPESSAAGLYTNAGDLCQTIIMLNSGGEINGTQVLPPEQISMMLAMQIGIFVQNQPDQVDYCFLHQGENYGFTANMQGYPYQAAGMAVMVNRDNNDPAQNAAAFNGEVISALIRVYGLQT